MESESKKHEVAWKGAKTIVDVFASLLREEERRDAFTEVYTRIRALLADYDRQAEWLHRRMRPSGN
jgi:hypothetical protein